MNYEVQAAVFGWDREVGSEMARLIRGGTPPFQAADKARRIVSGRRRYAREFAEADKLQFIEALRKVMVS